jgi:hypothetical protein
MLPLIAAVAAYYVYTRPTPLPDGPSLTLYYSLRCGHCIKFMPEWNKMPKVYKGIVIRSVESKNLGDEYPVEGFPTIVLRGEDTQEYRGERTATAIIQWLDNA